MKGLDSDDPDTLLGMYMEMCAALIQMTGGRDVIIPKDMFPVKPFDIFRRATADGNGLEVRFRFADETFKPN